MSHVLVTGASGMIGGELVRQLATRPKIKVRACYLHTPPEKVESDGVEWVGGDLLSPSFGDEICEGIDLVYHLAHPTVSLSSPLPKSPAATGAAIHASLILMDAMSRAGQPRRIVFLSSGGAMYGDRRRPGGFREDAEPLPTSAYGVEKLAIEHLIRLNTTSGAIRAVIVRVANAYGRLFPAERRQGLIGAALARALKPGPVGIFGSLDNVRDYIHVKDVGAALLRCFELDPAYEVFNVGTGHGTSVREVLHMLEQRLGLALTLKELPPPAGPPLPAWSVLEASKFKLATGWRPTISLTEGLDDMVHSALHARAPTLTVATCVKDNDASTSLGREGVLTNECI